MTKFSGTFQGQTDGGGKGVLALVAVGCGAVVAYKALGSAASTLGDLLVIVPVTLGALTVGALVTFVALKARRPRQPADQSAGRQLWIANPHASPLPPRETRAIAPAPVKVEVNLGGLATEIAGLVYAAQQQQAQPAPVVVPSETQELPR